MRSVANVAVPVPTTIDLLNIPPTNVADFFLWQPFQGSINRIYIGADKDLTFAGSETFQIIQVNENNVTELTGRINLPQIGLRPQQIDNIGTVRDGPVFIRVRMPARDELLFVTVEAIIPEIP